MSVRHSELWQRLPPGLKPPQRRRREAFLRAHLRPGSAMLDLGCGEGNFAALAAADGTRAIGVDIAPAAVRRARAAHPGLDVRLADPEGPLPLADNEVTLVWCSEVAEHVADTAHLLSEARRVLAPGGRLALTTPDHGRVKGALLALAAFERHFEVRGEHLRFYTARSLRALLEDFGFEDIRMRETGGVPLWRSTLLASARRARFVVGGR